MMVRMVSPVGSVTPEVVIAEVSEGIGEPLISEESGELVEPSRASAGDENGTTVGVGEPSVPDIVVVINPDVCDDTASASPFNGGLEVGSPVRFGSPTTPF
jgi:hypothetical protein